MGFLSKSRVRIIEKREKKGERRERKGENTLHSFFVFGGKMLPCEQRPVSRKIEGSLLAG